MRRPPACCQPTLCVICRTRASSPASQTRGGSTGLPRVTLFDPLAIEVQAIQTARGLYAQGARPGDVIQITYTLALPNAGWCAHDAIHRWLGATPLATGSGVVTPSQRQ